MNLNRILEAILFAADGPQTPEQIALAVPDRRIEEIEPALEELRDRYERENRGWRLENVAGGWQLTSHPDLYPFVQRFLEGRRRARLSRAAIETLAVIAYRQPITRGELEDLRGVDCGGVLHTLLERDLVTVRGRSKALGRPLIYATTEKFLEHFGLDSLASLPKLEEVETLWGSQQVRLQLEAEVQRRLGQAEPVSNGGEQGQGDAEREPGGNGRRGSEGAPETTLAELELEREATSDLHAEG